MPFVGFDKRLAHVTKTLRNRSTEFFIDDLKYAVDTIGHIGFRNFIDLFKRTLFKLYDELLIHSKNCNFKIRMRQFSYCSHDGINKDM